MMTWLRRILARVGPQVGRAMDLIGELLTDAEVDYAVSLVKAAQTRFLENGQRRDWVVAQLATRGISESIARLLVEIAVRQLKREGERLVDKAAGAIKV